jgi:hypothetical protein
MFPKWGWNIPVDCGSEQNAGAEKKKRKKNENRRGCDLKINFKAPTTDHMPPGESPL